MKDTVVQLFKDAGFVEDGFTSTELVRIPTTDNPVFGKSGGVPATLGGRLRLQKPGTRIRVTIGKHTTFLYYLTGSRPAEVNAIARIATKDLDGVRRVLAHLPETHGV